MSCEPKGYNLSRLQRKFPPLKGKQYRIIYLSRIVRVQIVISEFRWYRGRIRSALNKYKKLRADFCFVFVKFKEVLPCRKAMTLNKQKKRCKTFDTPPPTVSVTLVFLSLYGIAKTVVRL
ncbi:MAG TPA: hypothetical protein DHV55_05655 [Clostridiaceae bacterium]|nr:hypothetical protein [Clostridiaceae bacterium]